MQPREVLFDFYIGAYDKLGMGNGMERVSAATKTVVYCHTPMWVKNMVPAGNPPWKWLVSEEYARTINRLVFSKVMTSHNQQRSVLGTWQQGTTALEAASRGAGDHAAKK